MRSRTWKPGGSKSPILRFMLSSVMIRFAGESGATASAAVHDGNHTTTAPVQPKTTDKVDRHPNICAYAHFVLIRGFFVIQGKHVCANIDPRRQHLPNP